MDKKDLRNLFLQKRKSIDVNAKAKKDIEISRRICDLNCFKNARQVLVFSSGKDEFDTRYIIERCREQGKRTFFPRCLDKNGNMEFMKVDCLGDLAFGMYGILEPTQVCKRYKQLDGDIVIVPALAVDRAFNRLGYGKGYYDRFLKDFNGVSICPCYEELISDTVPTDNHDIKVSIIVTDKEVI